MPSMELGPAKTVFVLAIVMGCFAVLWPRVFYPMFQNSVMQPMPKSYNSEGCCDVIFEKDVNAMKLMSELCERILRSSSDYDSKFSYALQQGKLNKYIIDKCRNEVLQKCSIDISLFLIEKDKISKTHKHMLDEIRSFNSSICLKTYFGITPNLLGAPRHMRTFNLIQSKHQRPERLPHLRPDLMHPALRERGRAILHSHVVPRVEQENVSPLPRPGPIPGMRPVLGAAGHVVPPPKGGGTIGILMPIYTICIVVFFLYTMMRLMFRNKEEIRELPPDPEFRRVVFDEPKKSASKPAPKSVPKTSVPKLNGKPREAPKLVVSAISGLVEEVNRELELEESRRQQRETEIKESQPQESAQVETLEAEAPESEQVEEDIDKGAVKVVNIELTESCEGGRRWSNSMAPHNRSISPNFTSYTPVVPEPIEIFLEGSVPAESKVLVSQSETHPIPHSPGDSNSDSVVLASKVTLSLIGFDPVRRLF